MDTIIFQVKQMFQKTTRMMREFLRKEASPETVIEEMWKPSGPAHYM